MKAVEFCYWLQGYFEIRNEGANAGLSFLQTEQIKRHLALVFKHEIDPSYSADPKVQADMQATHDGEPPKKKPPRPRPTGGGLGSDVVYRC